MTEKASPTCELKEARRFRPGTNDSLVGPQRLLEGVRRNEILNAFPDSLSILNKAKFRHALTADPGKVVFELGEIAACLQKLKEAA